MIFYQGRRVAERRELALVRESVPWHVSYESSKLIEREAS